MIEKIIRMNAKIPLNRYLDLKSIVCSLTIIVGLLRERLRCYFS